jgi:hypothetical protein
MWQWLQDERPLRDGAITDEKRKEELINHIIDASAPEIEAAVLENRVARVFCRIWFVVRHYPGNSTVEISIEGDDTAVREGIRMAGDNFTKNRNTPIDEYIKASIATELARLTTRHIEATQKKSPEELLSAVLVSQRLNVMVLLEHLTFEQRNGLLDLLFTRTERKSLYMWLKDEPEDELLWRIWYTAVLQAYDAKLSKVFQEDTHPIFVPVGELRRMPPPKGVNPAGPMHARYYQQLVKDQQVVKEARQAGYDIRDLDSKSRIARLTGLDRRAITRYLASDVQVGIAPEEKGRVRVQFRLKDLQRSAEVSRGKKRGRKTKSP